ncbi:MAG: hypothetical protein RLZZ598_117 [Pseudomonadota bacterium]|jgi:small Trp-rich protein
MWFIALGVVFLLLKLSVIGPPGVWPWWLILSPFGAAAAWWWWADSSGFSKRAEMRKMDERKDERRRRNLTALGIDPRAHDKLNKRATEYRAMRSKQEESVERQRAAERQKHQDSIIHSRLDSAVGRADDEEIKR